MQPIEKLQAEAAKYGAQVVTYLGATDVILPEGSGRHFAATGTALISGSPASLLEDLAAGVETCDPDCEHEHIPPVELRALAARCGVGEV